MSSRRTLILVGAIVVGVIAALLIFNYVQGIEDRANDNAKRVDVYVAKSRHRPRHRRVRRRSADEVDRTSQIPQEFKPATAITTTDEIQKKVALFDIPQNTVIVEGHVRRPGVDARSASGQRLKNPSTGRQRLGRPGHGVGGFLVAGDEVNIMVFNTGEAVGQLRRRRTSGRSRLRCYLPSMARYLYQKVHILAVGTSPSCSARRAGEHHRRHDDRVDTGNSGVAHPQRAAGRRAVDRHRPAERRHLPVARRRGLRAPRAAAARRQRHDAAGRGSGPAHPVRPRRSPASVTSPFSGHPGEAMPRPGAGAASGGGAPPGGGRRRRRRPGGPQPPGHAARPGRHPVPARSTSWPLG